MLELVHVFELVLELVLELLHVFFSTNVHNSGVVEFAVVVEDNSSS